MDALLKDCACVEPFCYLWRKLRKSLGDKRKELSAEHIAEITRLYGDFAEGDRVKIMPNESFGFLRITVVRPLRLRWEIPDDTLDYVRTSPKLAKLAPDAVDRLVTQLAEHRGLSETHRQLAEVVVGPVLAAAGGFTPPQHKAIWGPPAVRDPEAPAITNRRGSAEPDPELREERPAAVGAGRLRGGRDGLLATVEYRSAVDDHLEAEVHPYVDDAWIDHTRTKIGYEIPLTRSAGRA